MSKGTRIVPVRIPDEVMSQIVDAVNRHDPRREDEEGYTVSSWIRKAIEEKLSHQKRSRRSRVNRRLRNTADPAEQNQPLREGGYA